MIQYIGSVLAIAQSEQETIIKIQTCQFHAMSQAHVAGTQFGY